MDFGLESIRRFFYRCRFHSGTIAGPAGCANMIPAMKMPMKPLNFNETGAIQGTSGMVSGVKGLCRHKYLGVRASSCSTTMELELQNHR